MVSKIWCPSIVAPCIVYIHVHLKLRMVLSYISLSLHILCIYNIIYNQILHITYILDNRYYMSLIIIIIYYYCMLARHKSPNFSIYNTNNTTNNNNNNNS